MNPEGEDQNYKPSRFLLKKQQALIQQATASDHRMVFTLTPELEKKRGFSAEPVKTSESEQKKQEINILEASSKASNERNPSVPFQKSEDKRRNLGSNIRIVMGMANTKPKPDFKGNKETEKALKPSEIRKETIFYPTELPQKQSGNGSPDFADSLLNDKFVLFQLPQILPFKDSVPVQNSNGSKEKIEKNIDFKDESNTNDILAYLMKDSLDSMGHEISHPYTGFVHAGEAADEKHDKSEKKDKKKVMTNNFDCDEGILLGKLQILKNRKARMVFGDVEFEIMDGMESKFVQELVGIDFLEKSVKPKAYFLSNIQKKFICKPNLENLLE